MHIHYHIQKLEKIKLWIKLGLQHQPIVRVVIIVICCILFVICLPTELLGRSS